MEKSRLVEPPRPDTPEYEPSPVKMRPISKPSPTEEKEVVKGPVPEDEISQKSFSGFSNVTQQEEVKLIGFTSLRLGGSAAHPQNSSPSVTQKNTPKKKLIEVFNVNDEESETKKKRKLIPLDEKQEEGPNSVRVMDKSSARGIHLFVPETAEVNEVQTDLDSFKHSTEDLFVQNQEQNPLKEKEKLLSEAIQELEKNIQENIKAPDAVKEDLRIRRKNCRILLKAVKMVLDTKERNELQLSQKDTEGSADVKKNNQINSEMGTLTPQMVTDSKLDENLVKRRVEGLLFIRRIIHSDS